MSAVRRSNNSFSDSLASAHLGGRIDINKHHTGPPGSPDVACDLQPRAILFHPLNVTLGSRGTPHVKCAQASTACCHHWHRLCHAAWTWPRDLLEWPRSGQERSSTNPGLRRL